MRGPAARTSWYPVRIPERLKLLRGPLQNCLLDQPEVQLMDRQLTSAGSESLPRWPRDLSDWKLNCFSWFGFKRNLHSKIFKDMDCSTEVERTPFNLKVVGSKHARFFYTLIWSAKKCVSRGRCSIADFEKNVYQHSLSRNWLNK